MSQSSTTTASTYRLALRRARPGSLVPLVAGPEGHGSGSGVPIDQLLVRDEVALAGHVHSGDVGFSVARLGREVLDGFTNHDEREEQRVVQQRRVFTARLFMSAVRVDRWPCTICGAGGAAQR